MKWMVMLPRVVATLAVVTLAAGAGWHLWDYYLNEPWTRDGKVRSDVTTLAVDEAGLIRTVHVHDNQLVHKGDLLVELDDARYKLAVASAESNLRSLQLTLAQKQRDATRMTLIGNAVASASREQSHSEADVAAANVAAAEVALDQARLNLARTRIVAPCNGYVTNLNLHAGEYVNAGSSLMALLQSDSFYVAGYFEETRLARVHPGDAVLIRPMGSQLTLTGHVASLAHGIQDSEQTGSSGQLATVSPTFQWVRLAQRLPVRVALDPLPAGVQLFAGQTVSVIIQQPAHAG